MKQGLKKFTSQTQGGRTTEGRKVGENFVEEVLRLLLLKNLKPTEFQKPFRAEDNNKKTTMTPDFIICNSKTGKKVFDNKKYLILESKYKQVAGSDWEKIESNFGYHEYFYNDLCNFSARSIIILSGYWEQLQNNYSFFIKYFKKTYGENVIFDFGKTTEEVYRFCKLMDIKLNPLLKKKIDNCWLKHQTRV